MKIERAIFLSRWDKAIPSGYQRLYFGAEFCSWAFPPTGQVFAALEASRAAELPFTLTTPILREETITELRDLFTSLKSDLVSGDEVVISDLGTLPLVRELLPHVEIVIGRALSGQKRGPRIENLDLGEEALGYFQQGRWYGKEAVALLKEYGVSRVELDNLLQGIAPLPKVLRGALHTPYSMVTSSRNCPFHTDKSGKRCAVSCGQAFTLQNEQTPHLLYQAGNSQFLKIDQFPENLLELGIDRLVVHEQIPR